MLAHPILHVLHFSWQTAACPQIHRLGWLCCKHKKYFNCQHASCTYSTRL